MCGEKISWGGILFIRQLLLTFYLSCGIVWFTHYTWLGVGMKYEKKKGKWIFNKDGVYFSLTSSQVTSMRKLLQKIEEEQK